MIRAKAYFLLYFKIVMFLYEVLQQTPIFQIQPAEFLKKIVFKLGALVI